MPTSDKQGKFIAKALISSAQPTHIWDVGAGQGTYFDLLFDYLDDCYWIAVEIWKPYIEKYELKRDYDLVIQDDIRNYPFIGEAEPRYDLIIFGDVLEHMPEDDARALILKAKEHFRWILVSIPIVHAEQGEVNGNPYEAHLKHWDFDEMHEAMGKCMAFKGHTIGLFWWDSEEDI
jgi:hypothetical protein